MKELSIEQKAKAYDKAFERAKKLKETCDSTTVIGWCEYIFPELKESDDERIMKALITFFNRFPYDSIETAGTNAKEAIAWLEKQGKHSIYNVPSREVILAIWDLGNEWKELTNGSISTEYGTQLDYIQKHWHESEYYLKEKQGEQKPAEWSEEDMSKVQRICKYLNEAKKYYADITEVRECIDWLKSLKDRVQPKHILHKRTIFDQII